MKILALDCALITGWAFWDNIRVESGVQDFSLRRGESPGMRFLHFNRWLRAEFVGAELVVYEQAHHRGGASTEVGVGLATRAQEYAAEIRAEHVSCHTATLKKFATGNGRAEKPLMILAARGFLLGRGQVERVIEDDNEADALCLLAWALAGCPQSETKKKRKGNP